MPVVQRTHGGAAVTFSRHIGAHWDAVETRVDGGGPRRVGCRGRNKGLAGVCNCIILAVRLQICTLCAELYRESELRSAFTTVPTIIPYHLTAAAAPRLASPRLLCPRLATFAPFPAGVLITRINLKGASPIYVPPLHP